MQRRKEKGMRREVSQTEREGETEEGREDEGKQKNDANKRMEESRE